MVYSVVSCNVLLAKFGAIKAFVVSILQLTVVHGHIDFFLLLTYELIPPGMVEAI